jgi:tyrosine-protein phosphatase YwqE
MKRAILDTDIHSHILPGVDDGIKTVTGAREALLRMAERGVTDLVLTPHVMTDYPNNTTDNLRAAFLELRRTAPDAPTLYLAGEYMLDSLFPALLKQDMLCIGRRYILVETSYLAPPPDLHGMLYEIMISGYKPILAHPERYIYMDVKEYDRIMERGCKLQLNLFSLVGMYGNSARRRAEYLLDGGMYDFAGSDIHVLDIYLKALDDLSLNRKRTAEVSRLAANNRMIISSA